MEHREEVIVKNSLAKKKKNGANGNHNRADKAGRFLYPHEDELGQFYRAPAARLERYPGQTRRCHERNLNFRRAPRH